MRTLRVFRHGTAVPLITCLTFLLLTYAYPVYWDGNGPMPSFFYDGRTPTTAEYNAHRWHYGSLIFLPYFLVSILLVWLSVYVAPKLSNRISRSRKMLAGIAFALILASALLNDVFARVFNNGLIVLSLAPHPLFSFLIVAVPVAQLSAMTAREPLPDHH